MPMLGAKTAADFSGPRSFADVLSIIGAGLKDASPGSSGDALAKVQALLGARQQQAEQLAFLSKLGTAMSGTPGTPAKYQDGPAPSITSPGLMMDGGGFTAGQDNLAQGGALDNATSALAAAVKARAPGPASQNQPYQYQPPVRTADATPGSPGLNINSPDLPMLALKAQLLGVPLKDMLDVMKAQQPDVHYDRGFGYNGKTGGAMGAFHPDLDKGQGLGADGSVANLPGAVRAAAEMAGGVEGAKANAQAPYQAVQTFDAQGRPMTINALTLAGGADGKGGAFVGQSPAQTAADTAVATAGANADIGLPQALSTAQQAVGLIEQMKAHPGLDSRVGWRGMLPPLPDTPGSDFQAMQDQLKGKVFLQAYGDLKGAGQITEIEGKKATDAIARLNNTQTKPGYLKALGDLEDVINTGATRAAQQSQRLQPNASTTPRPSTGPRMTGFRSRIVSVQ